MCPSLPPPILMWCSCARPWVIATRFSLRVSTQRTGRPMCLAAHATTIDSRSMPILAPNPPPTSGATTRIASGGSPMAVRISRAICAFWVDAQTVSLPSTHAAAVDRPSIGRQATRWLTTSPSTMTSQPSKIESSLTSPRPWTHTFVPAVGKSRLSPARAASMDATAGSGS